MGEFRILHASDLHIGARAGRYGFPEWLGSPTTVPTDVSTHDPAVAEGIVKFLIDLPDFDLVLLTGDIATTARPDDLAAALAFVQGTSQTIAPGGDPPLTLASTGLPVSLIPGNHDRFSGRFLLPKKEPFDSVFASYWPPGSDANLLALLRCDDDGEQLAIVGADFSLAQAWDATNPVGGYLGQGRVYAAVLSALGKETARVRAEHPGAAVIWAVHFPPEFVGLGFALDLIDEQWLSAAATQQKVSYLLTGHTHSPASYATDSAPQVNVLCAGTAAQWGSRQPQRLHARELEVRDGMVVAHREQPWQWHAGAGEFQVSEPRPLRRRFRIGEGIF